MAHVEGLRGKVPDRILELTKPMGIQDGLISQVRSVHGRKELTLIIRCGHLRMGYYNLELRYLDWEMPDDDDITLDKIARSTKSQREFGCDLADFEIDVAPGGGIEHRLLFHASPFFFPGTDFLEFAVRCRDLRWRVVPVKSRRLAPFAHRT